MHNRLIRLILEVAVPPAPKLWERPVVHLLKFLLGRTDLDTSLNAIRSERSSAINVPLVEHGLLHLLVATRKVIEGLNIWLGTIGCEGEIVILEIETDTG